MDTNERIRAKLVGLSRSGGLEPITVTQNFGEGNVEKTVRLFDFDKPENNDFLVTNQFQLDGLKLPIFPDIVIYVNGIPLVMIECKSPSVKDPINEAVEKNFERYQSRGAGYERLLFFNHFLIATCGTLARHGTLGSSVNHYARWSEAYPLTEEEIEKMCGGKKPREQEILISGMLSKSHILDLLKNYVIYETYGNKKIKKLAKHQQYRVVTKAVERLNLEKDIADQGGVIWHTQGSGKSLSMLWLATQLMFRFGNPPIVLVTDRKQLDEQIHGTFKACGFPDPISAKSRRHLQKLLSNPRGKTIMTTIQKFGSKETHIHTDEKVIALVDEGHRSQYRFNAEAMRSAMPNAVFFAFSGTPIDKKNKSTYRVFGPLLDKYSFEESKQDGATLKILYENRMPDLYVEGADKVDHIFERVFSDLGQEEKDRLKKEHATREKISEAPARIRKISLDLIDHYTKGIEPKGIEQNVIDINRLFEKYAYSNVQPRFETDITYNDLKICRTVTFVFDDLEDKGKFSVSVKEPNKSSTFIMNFFRYFRFIQNIILIANKYEGYNWPLLKTTFALMSGYRNYNRIEPIYSVDKNRNSYLNNILRKAESESMRLANNEEPVAFSLVKHKLAYRLNDIEYNDDYGAQINSRNRRPIEILEEDSDFKRISNLLMMTLGLKLKVQRLQNTMQYQFDFLGKQGTPINIDELSSGEKGILHFIFSLYGHDLEQGLMIIDEPEIHIHPQVQKKYVAIMNRIIEQLGLQFIIATHSPIFVNTDSIRGVHRFYKNEYNSTSVIRPEIDEEEKDLVRILNYTNSSKIFFSNKVILVEGPSDEFFYRNCLDEYIKNKRIAVADIEVQSIQGKRDYPTWRGFLNKYKINSLFIGDLDNMFEGYFSILSKDKLQQIKTEFESSDKEVSESIIRDQKFKDNREYNRKLLAFIRNKKETWENISSKIREKYHDGIYILSDGELEDYIGTGGKGMQGVIEFCKNDLHNWFFFGPEEKRKEIETIFDSIVES
jgi:HsdR family type I site-specific deoxyribonuclease